MITNVHEADEKIQALAALMLETFGDRALPVAQQQMEASDEESSVAQRWRQIIAVLRVMHVADGNLH